MLSAASELGRLGSRVALVVGAWPSPDAALSIGSQWDRRGIAHCPPIPEDPVQTARQGHEGDDTMAEVKVEIIIRDKANGPGVEVIKRAGSEEHGTGLEGPSVAAVLPYIKVTE